MSVPQEFIAIALVVDSSSSVYAEWRQILVDYVGQFMRRLTDSNPKNGFRIAFVTYALADNIPSPILCRRFFTEYTAVVKAMREDASSLGVGHTNRGGTEGMAALEGLVAGVELFDELAASLTDGTTTVKTVNHILHIALSSPDDAIHPSFNNEPELDQVTWDTLHHELKKRNIHYNLIAMKQSSSEKFSKLHRSVTSKPTSPWFAVKPAHSVLLSGLPSPAQQKAAPKRPNDAAERQLEPKRPRITEPPAAEPVPVKSAPVQKILTPRLAPAASLPVPQPAPGALPAPVAVPISGPSGNASRGAPPAPPFANMSPQEQHNIIQRIQVAETQLKELKNKIDEARAVGQHNIAEMQDYAKKRTSLDQFKHAISVQILSAQAAQNQSKPPENLASTFLSNVPNPDNAHSLSSNPAISVPMLQPPLAAQMMYSQAQANSNPSNQAGSPFHNLGQSSSPVQAANQELNLQLQKMVEQQRNRQSAPIANNQPGPPFAPPTFGSPIQRNQMPQPPVGNNAPVATPAVVWTGPIKWTGQGSTGGKKEVQALVSVHHASQLTSHAHTWPPAFVLIPTQEPAVTMQQLQQWMSLHKPIICPIHPHQREQDPHNAQVYQSLVSLLSSRSLYATASWTTPSGSQTRNVLFFPYNNKLFGAFFPLTGIPEMPKMSTVGTLHPAVAAHLEQMTPEQRMVIAVEMKRRQQMAAMQNAMGHMGMPNAAGNPGFNAGGGVNRNMNSPFTMTMPGMMNGGMQQGGNGMMPPNQGHPQ